MGLFGKLFNPASNYPELDANSPEAETLNGHRADIRKIIEEVKESIEVVLSQTGFYVLIGKPPNHFGFEWVEGDELKNFKSLIEANRVNPVRMERIVDRLSEAYKASKGATRFRASIGDRDVIVTKSDELASALKQEVDKLST